MADKGADNINIEEYENSCPYRKYLTPKLLAELHILTKQKCKVFHIHIMENPMKKELANKINFSLFVLIL